MPLLHMSKVAVGCASLSTLERRNQGRLAPDGHVPITTRFCPKRADELVGGSLYWIIKHRVTARQAILGFDVDDGSSGGARRTTIRLDPRLIVVRAVPKRAHQGWRYLLEDDAPKDFDGTEDDGLSQLPPALLGKLVSLALL